GSPTFNVPGEPMLDPVTACFAAVGLLLMLRHLRRGYNAYLLLVGATLLLVGTVFVQNLDVRRLQGITIFVAVAAATSVEHLWLLLRRRRAVRVAALAGGLAAALFVGAFSYHLYFVRMAYDPAIRRAFKDYY